jgi:hypothetical protein
MLVRAEDCSWLDVGCQASNTVADAFNSVLRQFADQLAAWFAGLLRGALNADASIKIFTANDQTGAFANLGISNQFAFWLMLMSAVVVIVGIVQLIVAIALGSGRRIQQVSLAMLASVPTVYVGTLAMQQANVFVNAVTDSFMDLLQNDKDGGLTHAMLNMTGLSSFEVTDPNASAWSIVGTSAADGARAALTGPLAGGPLMAVLVLGFLLVAVMFLSIAMLVRIFGLAVLAAMAPIPLMFIGQPKFKAWAKGWAEIVTGLLLAKPLAAGIIGVCVAIAAGGSTDSQEKTGQTTTDLWGVVAGFVGLLIASAAPAMTIALTRWAGNEVQAAVAARPSVTQGLSKVQSLRGAAGTPARVAGMLGRARSGSRVASTRPGGRGTSGGPGRPATDGREGSGGKNGGNGKHGGTGRPGTKGANGNTGRTARGGFYRRRTTVPRQK